MLAQLNINEPMKFTRDERWYLGMFVLYLALAGFCTASVYFGWFQDIDSRYARVLVFVSYAAAPIAGLSAIVQIWDFFAVGSHPLSVGTNDIFDRRVMNEPLLWKDVNALSFVENKPGQNRGYAKLAISAQAVRSIPIRRRIFKLLNLEFRTQPMVRISTFGIGRSLDGLADSLTAFAKAKPHIQITEWR